MNANLFRSNNCFIACEELANKDSFYTGLITGSIVSAVQGSAFGVQINRTPSKQLGSSYYAVNSPLRQPDVNLSFSYYQSYPYFNEGFVNLANLNDTGVTGGSPSSGFTSTVSVLSGYEDASRNFYILTKTGDAIDAFTGFVETDSPDFSGYQCASVGNCYLTNYSLSYAVGGLPIVEVQFLGSNMQYTNVSGTTVDSPAINLASGNANQVGELCFSGLKEFEQNPTIMNPADTGSLVTLQNLQVGGQVLSGEHLLQSVDLSLDIPRTASYGLGSDYVYDRKMLRPVLGSVSFSSQVSNWEAGVLSGILGSESGYNFDLTLAASGKSITYKIEDAKLQSYNYQMGVNGRMDFNPSFMFEVSPNPGGLQISGNMQKTLSEHATQQIDKHFNASMTMGSNGSMLVDFTDPNGDSTGGGYGAARSGDFWAADIDFTALSVWNSRGYPAGDAAADYRMGAGTAVTKRHIVMAEHLPLMVGNTVWFVEPDGTWISREITRAQRVGSTDARVCLLDSDLPNTITPVKVVPSNIQAYFLRREGNHTEDGLIDSGFRPIVVGFDHEKKGLLMQLKRITGTGMDTSAFEVFDAPAGVPPPYDELAEDLTSGDSGSPCFFIIGGKPILIGTWEASGDGPSYGALISDINALILAVDTAEGVLTGYTLQEIDLGPFGFRRFEGHL
jgi:hypothetical protein